MSKSILTLLLLCIFIGSGSLYAQEDNNLECRLVLNPFSFNCLSQEDLNRERKKREDVYIPESQIEVFKRLETKEKELEDFAKDRENRIAEMKIIEERVERKINELRQARMELEEARAERIEIEGKDIAKIVSYYEKMDPENAAQFINIMDQLTAAQILMRMNPRKGAAVMELLVPEVAVQITERVALFKSKLEEAAFFNDPNRNLPPIN